MITQTASGEKDLSSWNFIQTSKKRKTFDSVLTFEAMNCIAMIEKLDK
jgi:hypothetical protein